MPAAPALAAVADSVVDSAAALAAAVVGVAPAVVAVVRAARVLIKANWAAMASR